MAHLAKHTRAAVGNLCAHYDRSAGNISNEEIKPEKTCENYNLAPDHPDVTQTEFIQKRCTEARTLNRKDVNVMCSWVVTAPKDLPAADEEKFFKSSYDFLTDRYGGEKNIISAFVHKDEITPHMHFAFVPVVADQKRGGEKVSAHEAVNRRDLQTFHKDLSRHMERTFGRDIGILNGATDGGNRSVAEMKAEREITRSQEKALEASKEANIVQSRVNSLKSIESTLQGKIEGLERTYKGKVLSQQEVDKIQPEKGSFGTVKGVSLDDIQNLKKTTQRYQELYHTLKVDHNKLLVEYEDTKKRLPSMEQRIEDANNKIKLQDLEKKIGNLEKAIKTLPFEAQKQITAALKPEIKASEQVVRVIEQGFDR